MFIYRHTVQRGDGQLEPAGGETVKQADPLLAGRRESLDAVGRASIMSILLESVSKYKSFYTKHDLFLSKKIWGPIKHS